MLKFGALRKSNNFRELGIMPSLQKIQAIGLQANIHAASSHDGTSELGIMSMIPNH